MRLCAWAAICGGALRAGDAFIAAAATPRVQQMAYWITDVMLVAGLCGIYIAFRKQLRTAGLLSFLLGLAGFLLVRGAGIMGLGQGSYLVAASVTLIGVVALGLVMWRRTRVSKLGPALWQASLIIGLLGLATARKDLAIIVSGVLFGLGFVTVGFALVRGVPSDSRT